MAGTQIVSQTQDVYDGYGNETGQYDSQSGAVNTSTTPETTVGVNGDENTGSADPFGATTSNTYQGGTVTQTNQSGHDIAAQYNYDPMTGNLSSLKLYPSGTVGSGTAETTSWDYYSSSGLLKQKTYADGTTDAYVYNAKQQITSLTRPGETITNTYNPAGDPTSSSATDSLTGTSVSTTDNYDSTTGLLSSVTGTTTTGGNTVTTTNTFSYTPQGNVQIETQAGGVTTEYTYYGDNASVPGAIQSMKLVQNGVTISETDYTYDSSQRLSGIIVNGRKITIGYQSGKNVLSSITSGAVSTNFTYDSHTGNLTGINAGSAYSAGYTYNTNNQRATQTVSQTNADGSTTSQNENFTYDNQNELATVTSGGTTLDSYSYDSVGNRTDSAFAARYGIANGMNEYSNITYNARGDVTNDGTFAYSWNASDQMTLATANDNSVRVALQYDGQGRLIQKDDYTYDSATWTLSSTRKFIYDGTHVVEELDGNNNPVTGYGWGPNGLLTVTDYTSGTPKLYVAVLDGTGNVVGLIDSITGAVAATYTYDPYGKLLTHTGPAEAVCNELSDGGYYVRETDDEYLLNRILNLRIDRFLTEDPSGISGGLNPYPYCKNDPVNYTDPSGLAPESLANPPTISVGQLWERSYQDAGLKARGSGLTNLNFWETDKLRQLASTNDAFRRQVDAEFDAVWKSAGEHYTILDDHGAPIGGLGGGSSNSSARRGQPAEIYAVPPATTGEKIANVFSEAGQAGSNFTANTLNLPIQIINHLAADLQIPVQDANGHSRTLRPWESRSNYLFSEVRGGQYNIDYNADPNADKHIKWIESGIGVAGVALGALPGEAAAVAESPITLAGQGSVLPSAAAADAKLIGALEDWEGGASAYDRVAARDAAWEADNAISIHGNSKLSTRTAQLYGLYKQDDTFLKWGISQNMAKRYPRSFMTDKYLVPVSSGPRSDMLMMERNLVETQPGPLNREPWAGSRAGGQP